MKKIATILLTVVLTLCCTLTAFSASGNAVGGGSVTAKTGETVSIPIAIDGNTGFMGFGIIVTYDAKVLTPISVEKGAMLTGMFEDSLATSDPGSFKVIHAATEDNRSDGVLFTAVFRVAEDAKSTEISLAASADDTFKEGYETVDFRCAPILVTVENAGSNPDQPDLPTTPDDPEEELKLSERISNWAASRKAPMNTIMKIVVAPVVFVLRLFGK